MQGKFGDQQVLNEAPKLRNTAAAEEPSNSNKRTRWLNCLNTNSDSDFYSLIAKPRYATGSDSDTFTDCPTMETSVPHVQFRRENYLFSNNSRKTIASFSHGRIAQDIKEWDDLATLTGAAATSGNKVFVDESAIAALEARQQAQAIILGQNFQASLETLLSEELVSQYDLQQVLGISRANLTIWRSRRVEKLRSENKHSLYKLLFCWKLWLRVSQGEPLGKYLRLNVEGFETTLFELIKDNNSSDDLIRVFLLKLANASRKTECAALQRRRDLAGLPNFSDSAWGPA